jgi:protein SCO1/2
MWVVRTVLLSLGAVLWHGCSAPAPSARQYQLEGQILAIRPEDNEVLIKHGDIKGFMPGMTMPFKVRDAALLADKSAGDLVTATLMVADTDAWIASLDKTGSAPLTDNAAIPPASFVKPLKPGDEAPGTALVDHTGAPIALSAWRGSAVAVTFIYIRCPLPQFCPLLDRRFADVQRAITADAALTGRAKLLSVSFDPDADTIPRLKAHAERLHADPDIWRFATAPREVVDRFASEFGVNVIREHDGTITHNMRTTVISPDGRVTDVFEGSDWTPSDIVEAMRRSLSR